MDTNTLGLKDRQILTGINLNLDKPEEGTQSIAPVTKEEVLTMSQQYQQQLRNDPSVQALTSKISVTDPQSIISFGEDATNGINEISNELLKSIKSVKQEDAGEIINQLAKLMQRFNKEEIKEITQEPSFLKKLLRKAKNSIDDILQKYDSMSAEVDKIYLILKKYEVDIKKDTETLQALYNSNVDFYDALEKHIVAGQLGIEQLENEVIPQLEAHSTEGGLATSNYTLVTQCKTMLEERVYDLQLAENVALQSLPMIQQMQMGNFELMKTIKSSFIITLPIFKQCLINAVVLKRQELMAKNIQALRETTNEMMLKNAQNTSKQNVLMAKMAGQGVIDVEKLEQSFNTIIQGIDDTKKQQQENKINREKGQKELAQLKEKILQQQQQQGTPLQDNNVANLANNINSNNGRIRL